MKSSGPECTRPWQHSGGEVGLPVQSPHCAGSMIVFGQTDGGETYCGSGIDGSSV
jgi:hypothetical protein